MTTPATPMTSKDVAEALNISAKELRVFLRSPAGEGLSSREGKSYVFTKADLAKIRKAYPAWVKERAASKAAKAEAKKADADTTPADDAKAEEVA
jgi:hypothetical protein